MNTNYSTLYFSLKGSIIVYFINLSIIIIIASYTSTIIRFLDFNNLVIKSIITSSYSIFSIGANYIFLYNLYLADLFC